MKGFVTIINLSLTPPLPISFEAVVPDTLSESNSASFSPITIQGRSSPLDSYESSGPRTINITASFHEDDMEIKDLEFFINKIKTLTYPEYVGGRVVPPKCYLKIGKNIRLIGFCGNVDVTWKTPIRDGHYISADISLPFTESVDMPYSASEVLWGMGRYKQNYG